MELRWVILILGIFSQLGGYMAINFPAYMYLQLLQIFDITTMDYNLLFTVIAVPNIFMPFIAGYLTSKVLNPRKMFFITVTSTFLGQSFCTYSILTKQFYFLIFGRLLIGIGHTNINQPRNQLITKWFYNKELSFAFSGFSTVGKLGILGIAYFFSYYQDVDLSIMYQPVLFINLFCLLAFVCSIMLVKIDQMEEDNNEETQEIIRKASNGPQLTFFQKFQKSFSFESLPPLFFLISFLSCLGCLLTFPYMNNIQLIIQQQYGISGTFTVYLQIVLMAMSGLLLPLMGCLVDNLGKIPVFYMCAGVIATLTYLFSLMPAGYIFENNYVQSVIPFALLGLFMSIFSVVDPSSPSRILKQENIGLAVGINQSFINLNQSVIATFTGYLLGIPGNGYQYLQFFLMGLGIVFIFVSAYVYYVDSRGNKVLFYSKNQNQVKVTKCQNEDNDISYVEQCDEKVSQQEKQSNINSHQTLVASQNNIDHE